MLNTTFEPQNTEKRLVFQIDPGVRRGDTMLLTKHYTIQVNRHDGEVGIILLLSFGSVGSLPMVAVHRFENPPFRIVRKLLRNRRAVEAILDCWCRCFSCQLISYAASSKCCIGKPVAYHYPVVAEGKFIEPVNDYLCASRHYVGRFDVNHNCNGFKLNNKEDGVSISMFPTQLKVIEMSECASYDNAEMEPTIWLFQIVAKCQRTSKSGSPKRLKNGASNHVSNHDGAFVISAISIHYKGVSECANHASNHDNPQIWGVFTQLTTQVTTGEMLVICVIPIIYNGEILSANHVSNHDSLKMGGSKMIVTTQVTTTEPPVTAETSTTYNGSKMSVNHASNHGATSKLLPKKTYSIYNKYNNILNIIILYWESKRARTYVRARERNPKAACQKNEIFKKNF